MMSTMKIKTSSSEERFVTLLTFRKASLVVKMNVNQQHSCGLYQSQHAAAINMCREIW